MMDLSLPYGYVCSHFLSDYDKSPSTQCTLMMENECWISFNVVGGEAGATAYNLQMYGKFYNSTENKSNTESCGVSPSSSSVLSQVAQSLPTFP